MKGNLPRRSRQIALGVLLLAYAAFAATGCGADQIVLGENHATLKPDGAQPRTLKVDGLDVEYWVTQSPGARDREPAAFVLYFTGKGHLAQQWIRPVADAWGDHPVELWAMNYPGSGGSDGPARLARVGPSALAVFDALQVAAGGRPVFVQGGSFGTTAALHVGAHRPVAGLILKNPPALRELIMGSYGWWNLWLAAWPVSRAIPADLDSLANAARCTAPAIILSAGADVKVPARYHEQVINAYAGRKDVIRMPGAGHDDPMTRASSEEFAAALDRLWAGAGLSEKIPPDRGVPAGPAATPSK